MAEATLTEVMKFFDMKPPEFRVEWAALDAEDKNFFKTEVAKAIGKE